MNMPVASLQAPVCSRLAGLLEYPDADVHAQAREFAVFLEEFDAASAAAINAFVEEISELSMHGVQELYSRTFDLAPVCAPYVSVHLFTPENFKRAELMTGLKEAYARAGFDCGTELPDHIAQILKCAPLFDAEEWEDAARLMLAPAAAKMLVPLERAKSPWRHIMLAVQRLLTVGDELHA